MIPAAVSVMLHECPNCRERVSYLRMFRTPAWGTFRCAACGSVLTISLGRRLLAAGLWLGLVIFLTEFGRLDTWGRMVIYPTWGVLLFAALYACEKVILVERRAFTCKLCGYDLQALTKHRCPECGTPFDPAEREQILKRIQSPSPKPRYRKLAALVVVLLSSGVVAGFVAWRQASRRIAPVAGPATARAASATSAGDDGE